MAQPVSVCVEAPLEYQVQEITYDGQEIFSQPMSMSDNLTKLAHKIDFNKAEDGKQNDEEAEEDPANSITTDAGIGPESQESKDAVNPQGSQWPWEFVRNKLRNALTEVCVLSDVLNITKGKRYMVPDQVSRETPEPKRIAQMLSKKKAMTAASSVLLLGTERLRSSQSEMNRNRNAPDFHMELLRLRQNWHLKKVGSTILGDLSYKTAGSRFWHNGVFEVTKAEDAGSETQTSVDGSNPNNRSQRPSALKVSIPSVLEGVSYIQVTIQGDNDTLCSAHLTIPTPQNTVNGSDSNWQQKLEAAQNVLFCKELFTQLAREAVQLQANIPHIVVGNQITATLFPGIHLCIGLCHSSNKAKDSDSGQPNSQKPDHNHVLEHSLHQLLRELHYKNVHHPMPHPTTATLGVNKRRRLAGPEAYDRYTLLEMTQSETLLEQIIKQGQLYFIRMRTSYVIDNLAREIKDPLIVAHWNCLTSPTKTCVKINIMSHGYETNCRTSLVLHIEPTSLKAICRDGRVINLSYDPKELRDLIMCQIVQHQVQAMQSLSKPMSWQILASSNHVGVGPVEPLGNAASALLASPSGDRIIALRYGTNSGIQVSIQSSPRKDFYTNNLVKDMKWQNLGGDFKEVRWEKMEGRNFINKMELLMASLTNI